MVWSHRFLFSVILGFAVLAAWSPPVEAQKSHSSGGHSSHAPSISSSSRGAVQHSGTATHHVPSSPYYNRVHYTYPYYLGSGYGYYSPYYVDPLYDYSYYPPIYDTRPLYPAPAVLPAEPVSQPAYIEVRLPTADAQVLLDGNPTTSTGTQRIYNSPGLAPGEYSYEVTAIWRQDGRDMRAVRTIRVTPGRTTLVDFTK